LDCEDELLALTSAVQIGYFLEAVRKPLDGDFDLTLVEGSISTPDQLMEIQEVRRRSRFLVTIGACATAGGIQALRNWGFDPLFKQVVYARPEFIETLATSTPIRDHVKVDFELRGCPINKHQLVEVVSSFLAGRKPRLSNASVCMECKQAGNVCVMVAQGIACLGPVTHAGCGAICPHYDRGCFGCYGPLKNPNVASMVDHLKQIEMPPDAIRRLLHTFNAWSEEFREAVPGEADSAGRIPLTLTQPQ
jgi:coenzyme F420-reducing hydrogenase gamma subunit